MTSFGWKRKVGEKVSRSKSAAFEQNTQDENQAFNNADVDWLTLAPRSKVICLEDVTIKTKRLTEEGSVLAEADRYWEALKKWDEALHLTPNDEKLYDMKSQAYMALGEVLPAVQAAFKSTELNPCWWPAYQTLGRAQLGMGEVRKAVKSFSRAIHLNPAEQELWQEDLQWATSLLQKKTALDTAALEAAQAQTSGKIVEVDPDDNSCSTLDTYQRQQLNHEETSSQEGHPSKTNIKGSMGHMPANYIKMKDFT